MEGGSSHVLSVRTCKIVYSRAADVLHSLIELRAVVWQAIFRRLRSLLPVGMLVVSLPSPFALYKAFWTNGNCSTGLL